MGYSTNYYRRGNDMPSSARNDRRGYSPAHGGSGTHNHPRGPAPSGGSLSSRFQQVEQERRNMNNQPSQAGRGGSSGRPSFPQRQQNQGQQQPKQRMPFGGSAPVAAGGASSRRGGRAPQVSRPAAGAVSKPRRDRRRTNMMDIDEPATTSSRPVGRFPMTTTEGGKKGKKRGGKTGGAPGGRGGKAAGHGGKRGGKKAAPLSRENLDADLDNYMMRDATTAKATLDADLENYMMGITDIPEQIGA